MKTIMRSNWRALLRALCRLLLGIGTLWAIPRSAQAQLYVSEPGGFLGGSVGEYNATTGAAINPRFISPLGSPSALAVSGNDLFVANSDNEIG